MLKALAVHHKKKKELGCNLRRDNINVLITAVKKIENNFFIIIFLDTYILALE